MKQQIDLYRRFAPPARGFSFGARAGVGLAAALGAILVLVFWLSLREVGGLRGQMRQLSHQSAQLAAALQQARHSAGALPTGAALEKEIQEATKRSAHEQRLLDKARYLQNLQRTGFVPYLTHLGRKNTAGLWLNRITLGAGGVHLALAGSALEPELIPRFIAEMAADEKFLFLKTAVLHMERPQERERRVDFTLETGSAKGP